IQSLALELINKDRNRPVRFGPSHPTCAMLACHEPALAIPCVAIAVVGNIPVDAHVTTGPPQHSVVWYVAPDQVVTVCKVDRAFRPKCSSVQPFEPSISERQIKKTLIVNLEFISNSGRSGHWVEGGRL